jgi:hypothetical protein
METSIQHKGLQFSQEFWLQLSNLEPLLLGQLMEKGKNYLQVLLVIWGQMLQRVLLLQPQLRLYTGAVSASRCLYGM